MPILELQENLADFFKYWEYSHYPNILAAGVAFSEPKFEFLTIVLCQLKIYI